VIPNNSREVKPDGAIKRQSVEIYGYLTALSNGTVNFNESILKNIPSILIINEEHPGDVEKHCVLSNPKVSPLFPSKKNTRRLVLRERFIVHTLISTFVLITIIAQPDLNLTFHGHKV
jgi:hypothetical protein